MAEHEHSAKDGAKPDGAKPATVVSTPRRLGWRIGRWVALGLSILLLVTGGAAAVAYRKLEGNIASRDVSDQLGERPQQLPTGATNFLLVGSDSREGKGLRRYGANIEGARSDTTILLHLSEGRDEAVLVSIPRDSYVRIPRCTREDGSTTKPHRDRFNSAYSLAGVACTIRTVEALTDIYIDDYVVVDFGGFKRMVDALGGVKVCLEEPVTDSRSGLDLPAGTSVVEGEQALAYVRARYSLGDGSDLSRIERQQDFLSAMVRKARSSQLLLNPASLYRFLDAATKSITTGPDLASLSALRELAQSVQGISTGDVRFVTVPVEYRPDGATVAWKNPAAKLLWESIRTDSPLPGEEEKATAQAGAQASTEPSASPVAPQDVQLRVLNGTGRVGVASEAAAQLRTAGFDVVEVTDAESFVHVKSVIRHAPQYDGAARTLSATLPGAAVRSKNNVGNVLELVIGQDFRGVLADGGSTPAGTPSPTAAATSSGEPTVGPSTTPAADPEATVETRAATEQRCS